MTDKVQKIRKEVEKLHGNPYYMMAVKDVLEILDMQEEPVSEELEDAEIGICSEILKGETIIIDGYEYVVLSDAEECFKAGAEWQKAKDEYITDDLGEYINELSNQFPEVSFAKLSRIAVRVAKWQKQKEYTCYEEAFEDGAKWKVENLWKAADGDDLPEIDREVIALAQPYPNDEHLRVVFAHRPNKYAKVWNSDLGEEQVIEIEGYDKGRWNIPNVKYWLDTKLPYEEK